MTGHSVAAIDCQDFDVAFNTSAHFILHIQGWLPVLASALVALTAIAIISKKQANSW